MSIWHESATFVQGYTWRSNVWASVLCPLYMSNVFLKIFIKHGSNVMLTEALSQPFWLKTFGGFYVILGDFILSLGQSEELEHKAFLCLPLFIRQIWKSNLVLCQLKRLKPVVSHLYCSRYCQMLDIETVVLFSKLYLEGYYTVNLL